MMRTMEPLQVSENYNPGGDDTRPVTLSVPDACSGLRLDRALVSLLPEYSRTRLAQWIRAGRVTVNGRAGFPSQKVWTGEAIVVIPSADPAAAAHQAEAIPLDIVFEDEALMVVNKPAGLVVHPGSGNWQGTMLNALLAHAPALAGLPRAGIVHRLDKDTSGLLVVARTSTSRTDLVRQLQARSVRREYLAVVQGRIARDGKIEAPIGRHPVKRTRMAVTARGKEAVTHYQVLERYDSATLLRCRLETGRTHQIRVHLSALGHPLLGDPAYGNRGSIVFPRQALHAERLALIHPLTRLTMSWQAPLPADMRELIATLRGALSASHRSPVTGRRSRRS
jgi:23S rRNA pseudouridine1911/1915/1917 synthase